MDDGQWVPFISAFPASSTTFAYGRHPASVPGWSRVIDRGKLRLGSVLGRWRTMETVRTEEYYDAAAAFQVSLVALGSWAGQGREGKAYSCPYRAYCAGPCPRCYKSVASNAFLEALMSQV